MPDAGCWSPSHGDSKWDYSDGLDVEMRLLDIIRSVRDRSSLSDELASHVTDWVSRYHLSNERSNLLRPLREVLSGSVLEVGAGCGALTRYLGESSHSVVALEGSAMRARIAAERCRDLPNVQVVADHLESFTTTLKFDAVTMIGVLEYATRFGGGPGAAVRWLKRVASLLRKGGCAVIAIENQLGLKYFAGAPEDHAGRAMVGIGDLYGPSDTRTYGLRELEQMLFTAGFRKWGVAIPIPDYKLPASVLLRTDPSFDSAELVASAARKDPQLPSPPLFALDRTWRVVARNGLLADLANSFLIVAWNQEQEHPFGAENRDVIAYHFSSGRARSYMKQARFVMQSGQVSVLRQRLSPEEPAAGPLQWHVTDEAYVRGLNWGTRLSDVTCRAGWTLDDLHGWFEVWKHAIEREATKDRIVVDWSRMSERLPGRFIDMMPWNLIIDGDDLASFIDFEWTAGEPIELGHLIFRALFHSLTKLTSVAAPADPKHTRVKRLVADLMASLDMKLEDGDLERHIQSELVFQQTVLKRTSTRGAEEYATIELPVLPEMSKLDDHSQLQWETDRLKAELASARREREQARQEASAAGEARRILEQSLAVRASRAMDRFPRFKHALIRLGHRITKY